MTLGTLRDQVIYPHTKTEMLKKGFNEAKLLDILEKVQIPARTSGIACADNRDIPCSFEKARKLW